MTSITRNIVVISLLYDGYINTRKDKKNPSNNHSELARDLLISISLRYLLTGFSSPFSQRTLFTIHETWNVFIVKSKSKQLRPSRTLVGTELSHLEIENEGRLKKLEICLKVFYYSYYMLRNKVWYVWSIFKIGNWADLVM